MTVSLGNTTFDNVFYDSPVDVLYLHKGDPASAVDFDETAEGDHVRFDSTGALVGLTILNAKLRAERDGKIELTIPQHLDVEAASLDAVFAAA